MQEQITSKTALLTWEYSSAKTEADRWNAQVKLHGVWKSVVWMELQQPSKSPRPSEVAFGHGKGSDVMAPVPTDLCGACEHRAPPRAQPGCGMAVGGVQSASVGQTVVSVPPELGGVVPQVQGLSPASRAVPGELMSLLPACPTECSHTDLWMLCFPTCAYIRGTHSQPRDPPLLCLALFE